MGREREGEDERFDLARIGPGLPVAAALDAIRAVISDAGRAVLTAPPGKGKTTLVPPLLANLAGGRIVVTQPRRVAARAAARRLAALAGVRLGAEVGYTVRGDAKVSAETLVEFCTTGVLVRRLLNDPDLGGVSAVVLDEVHERQLDSDLALAMVREVADLRDDLTLVAMSATLAADRFAAALGEPPTPVVDVPGVLHPLAIEWAPPSPGLRVLDQRGVTHDFLRHLAAVTARALAAHEGDGLVFLPGVREVERVVELLRAGRAARLGPGVAVRCFAEATWARLDPAPTPEIATADLTRAVLDLACWGSPRGEGLALLDPLPVSGLARAESTLRSLGAVDAAGSATTLGRRLATVPADPRLAKALIVGAERFGAQATAEVVAALESDQRAPGADLGALVRQLRRGNATWAAEVRRLVRLVEVSGSEAHAEVLGWVVATAYPDRIARRRASDPHSEDRAYLLASGTGADLPANAALGRPEWLAVAELDRSHTDSGAIIRSAVAISEDLALAAGTVVESDAAEWSGGRVSASRVRRLGAIELGRTRIRPTAELGRRAVAEALRGQGLDLLSWPESAMSLRRRLGFVHGRVGAPWPDVSDAALLNRLEDWLGPELLALAEGASARTLDLTSALRRLLPWPETGRLDELVPERLAVPTGSRIRIDYPDDPTDRPVLAVKLQECFGLTATPLVAGVSVLFHLLSPAGRPLAVTDDLASFWVNAYPGVRAENRGRYPKHPWPEDPLTAPPRRGTTRSGR